MSYAWRDDAASKLPAQKRPRDDAGEQPPANKRRRDPGEVRLFSANTCGFDWESIVTSEKPIDMAIDGHRAVPSVGIAKFNVALRRKSASITVSERPYKPSESSRVKAYVTQTTTTARELYDEMLRLYPNRVNPGALWASARGVRR
jgi:hypothetical protein